MSRERPAQMRDHCTDLVIGAWWGLMYLYPVHDVVRMRPYRVLEADDCRNYHVIGSAHIDHAEHALESVQLLSISQAHVAAAIKLSCPPR